MELNEAIKDLQALEVRHHHRMWQPFLLKYHCQVIAELGVYRGENFMTMIQHEPAVAVAVDSWINDGVVSRNDSGITQEELDQLYLSFKQRVADKPYVQVYREYTFEAVKRFPDNFFDLVYIDADHTYEACLRDITDWYPKVKPGGFLLGDDFWNYRTKTGVHFGVKRAVNEFTTKNILSFFEFVRHGWGIIK